MSQTDRMKFLLERANAAEDRADELRLKVALLERSVKAALNMDPTTAVQALMWIGRAEIAEKLLSEVLRFVDQRSLHTADFPAGWVAQAQAQMKTVEILRRDQERLYERPADDDYWATQVDPEGRRTVMRDDPRQRG